MYAARNFNKKQALEREVKDIYAKITIGTPTASTASLATTTAITLTNSVVGTVANGRTVTLHVAAAAANPTNTILMLVTGTAAAISITVTPNDGTNNTATPVTWTSANLREYLDVGTVSGKSVTLTDASSLLANIDSATGGSTAVLANGGNGDGAVATYSGATDDLTNSSVAGIASVARNSAGDYTITLQDAYASLKVFDAVMLKAAAQDIMFQLASETVATTKLVRLFTLTGATKTDPAPGAVILVKLELKNTANTSNA